MQRNLTTLAGSEFDLLVIGGGVHGLAVAYDAATRGLRVGLVERGDFGSEASSNHLKTVHGGLRYLQSADLRRMRESIVERRTVARIAPHLVTVLPYLMPTSGALTRSRTAMRAAFAVDALVGLDRNAGLPASLRLPPSRVLTRGECLALFPGAARDRLTGGAIWHDYQMRDAERVTMAFGAAADHAGAAIANYAEALALVTRNGRVAGARVRDQLSGDALEVRARLVLNAAGAGVGRFLEPTGGAESPLFLKALNLVTTRPMTGPALGASTRSGRVLFLVPWKGRMMAGTSQSEEPCEPDDSGVSEAEFARFVTEVNEAFPWLGLNAGEVSLVHRGIVPAERDRRGRLQLRGHFEIRDHARSGPAGLITLVGVKYTTARGVAERAVDLVLRRLELGRRRCVTGTRALPGGDIDDPDSAARQAVAACVPVLDAEVASGLPATYGSRYRAIVDLARARAELAARVAPHVPVARAQIVHAVREEAACHLIDVLVRRLPLGTAGHPGDDVVRACAELVGSELGWSATRIEEETRAVRAYYAPV